MYCAAPHVFTTLLPLPVRFPSLRSGVLPRSRIHTPTVGFLVFRFRFVPCCANTLPSAAHTCLLYTCHINARRHYTRVLLPACTLTPYLPLPAACCYHVRLFSAYCGSPFSAPPFLPAAPARARTYCKHQDRSGCEPGSTRIFRQTTIAHRFTELPFIRPLISCHASPSLLWETPWPRTQDSLPSLPSSSPPYLSHSSFCPQA